MRMFRVALLTIVGLETTQIPLSSRVDEQAVAVGHRMKYYTAVKMNGLLQLATLCLNLGNKKLR